MTTSETLSVMALILLFLLLRQQVNDIAQVFDNPQIKHREMLGELSHPENGEVPTVANPINFSRTPIVYNQAPPNLGEHTESVLMELLGYDNDLIEKLRLAQVI